MWIRVAFLPVMLAVLAAIAGCSVRIVDSGVGSQRCETPKGVMTGDDFLERSSSCDFVALPDPDMQAVLDASPSSLFAGGSDVAKQLLPIAQSVCISSHGAPATKVEEATSAWVRGSRG